MYISIRFGDDKRALRFSCFPIARDVVICAYMSESQLSSQWQGLNMHSCIQNPSKGCKATTNQKTKEKPNSSKLGETKKQKNQNTITKTAT